MQMQTDFLGVGFPHIQDLRWRVDVTLSSSSLAKVLQPSIVLFLTLDDGSVHTFQATKEQFHLLRHAVARSLHESEAVAPKLEHVAALAKKVKHRQEVLQADSLKKKSGFVGGRGG
mmetsp:Transcript_39589/g.75808  ORF Transcript_39589/g.75808 Transcript_39589/m.75808 type:complete len:116 (+) Transcript_39589:145-492(+)